MLYRESRTALRWLWSREEAGYSWSVQRQVSLGHWGTKELTQPGRSSQIHMNAQVFPVSLLGHGAAIITTA